MATLAPPAGEATPLGRVRTSIHELERGDVFWALPNDDPAELAQDAYRLGASGVVFQQKYVQPWPGSWSLEVQDATCSLLRLLHACRAKFKGSLVAVDAHEQGCSALPLVHRVLSYKQQGMPLVSGKLDCSGYPLGLAAVRTDHDFAVLEVGRSVKRAAIEICQPQIAVVLHGLARQTISLSSDKLAARHIPLLTALSSDTQAVLNADDESLQQVGDGCPAQVIWIGRSAGSDMRAEHVQRQGRHLLFSVSGFRFRIGLAAGYDLYDTLAAIAVGNIFGYSMAQIARALDDCEPPPARRFSAVDESEATSGLSAAAHAPREQALSSSFDEQPYIISFKESRAAAVARLRTTLPAERDISRFKAA